jgi:hypothetical protein
VVGEVHTAQGCNVGSVVGTQPPTPIVNVHMMDKREHDTRPQGSLLTAYSDKSTSLSVPGAHSSYSHRNVVETVVNNRIIGGGLRCIFLVINS